MHQSALLTDFYELTMAQGYFKLGRDEPAVFDMFFRKQPFSGGFSIFAGLGTLVETLEGLRFGADDLDYLRSLGTFDADFLDFLSAFRFSGELWAFPEGSVVFPQEPLVRVKASIVEAQIIESLLLNTLNFQSLIATKAARVRLASGSGKVMEFGLRRAQGPDGALSASRAAFVGGAAGTSNTLAGKVFGIPVLGTMAHSWIMSFPEEREAFEAYASLYPERTVFLIDTYDTLDSGIKNAIEVGRRLAIAGKKFGVRLDSGDIQYLSVQVRRALDEAGLRDATISVSNELDEQIIHQLKSSGAPIDSWGVGTNMVTGGSEASFTGVYKLAARCRVTGEDAEGGPLVPVMKISDNPDKSTNPGIKQVYRVYDAEGNAALDAIALEGETVERGKEYVFSHPSGDIRHLRMRIEGDARAMLRPYMREGRPAADPEPLAEIQARAIRELDGLDDSYKRLLNPHIYKVSITEGLRDLKLSLIEKYEG
jgi:nicotinate phosphoribosyltransferase